MKHLFLIRHAKSSWDDSHQPDLMRTLNERGLRNAPMMAKLFAEKYSPQQWFSSPAVRAIETAKFFAKASTKHALSLSNVSFDEINIAAELYSFELHQVVSLIESCGDNIDSAIYFFHNPTITEAINYYTGESLSVPTCAIALIEFNVDSWKHLSQGSGELKYFDYPKKHSDKHD